MKLRVQPYLSLFSVFKVIKTMIFWMSHLKPDKENGYYNITIHLFLDELALNNVKILS